MNSLRIITGAIILALASLAVRAADSGEERSELRQRADTYQAERARNPDFQPGEGRLSPEQRTDASSKGKPQAKRTTRGEARSAQAETRRAKMGKRVRSLKKIPGAFVRK